MLPQLMVYPSVRRDLFRARFLITALLFFGCVKPQWLHAQSPDGASGKIALLVPLTGNYAAIGEDNRQGVAVALEHHIGQAPFKIEYADSKADPSNAISEFRKVVTAQGAQAVFLMRSPIGMAVNPISRMLKIPLLGGVGIDEFTAANQFAFRVWSSANYEGEHYAHAFRDKGFRRIALITAEDEWTSAVSRAFRSAAERHGPEMVFDQSVTPQEQDFRTLLLRVKARNPDVVFVNLGLAQIGLCLRQARELRISAVFYSNFWVSKKDVQSVGAEIIEGVRYFEMDTDLPIFRAALKTKFNSQPSGATLSAYAGMMLLLQAANGLSDLGSSSLYQALMKQKELRTPDRTYQIRDRTVVFPLAERIIHEGRAEFITAATM